MSLLLTQASSWINSNETLKNSSITLHILYSICHNIFEHPSEIKLRTLKLDNAKFKANVLNVEGAVDLLYLCGFEMDTNSNCLILKQVNENMLKELHDLGNLFNSYCSDDVKSPKPTTVSHQSSHTTVSSHDPFTSTPERAPPVVRHHDLFHHHDTSPPPISTTQTVSQQQQHSTSHDFNDEEYLKKQHDLEERRKQLAEEKRIKKEEAMKIKNQSKLDRKEKHDEDEYEHGLNIPQHHATHHQGNTSSNPFYSGMTTYKDLGQ
ncbi:PUG domain-containing protein [Naegleria gruberi]|uniref:PUG domain-containing protein n=1 Tax=Naegleria gruberi TaxID=5762 RepID=D2VE46_NAEGR|nr:PUG domain-containing protein [Naegleria gruberi]EFC44732.1 PUG domain-containing protein [Naegleria gruberi]|eukprot:XP_002677476.1 PUG domain-containing protein [Naegleria gruberi strain NEG-M]